MSDPTGMGSLGPLVTSRIPKPQTPLTRLYHYTSFDAVKEILLSSTLHLTHAAFSNDPTELTYGLDLMRKIFEESGRSQFNSDDFLRILYYNTQPYIFCLSESDDMLTQWEMYSGRNGCCITFTGETKELTEGDGVALAPVIYEEERQRKHLKFLDAQRRKPEYTEQNKISNYLYFILSVVFLKSIAFSHEKEWRIVEILQKESFDSIKYRSGRRFLKPYVELPREFLPISEIKVGPADDQDRLFRSMEHLTKMTKGYEDVVITKSNIKLSPT